MKQMLSALLAVLFLCLTGCDSNSTDSQLVCTTLPVCEFTTELCNGTDLIVSQLITDNVSCLHDYTLKPSQMRAIENADAVIISGNGLEFFLYDALESANRVIDASGSAVLDEKHEHHGQDHSSDPHIWLSPFHAKAMADQICTGLIQQYPQFEEIFKVNLTNLCEKLDELQIYGINQLSDLSCRELITFHDGFSYLAESFDLQIIKSIEEESGSEASAFELIEIIELIRKKNIPVIFTEKNGSTAAAEIITRETGINCCSLDMAISGNSYFDAMYHNINTLREALQ